MHDCKLSNNYFRIKENEFYQNISMEMKDNYFSLLFYNFLTNFYNYIQLKVYFFSKSRCLQKEQPCVFYSVFVMDECVPPFYLLKIQERKMHI